MGVYWQMFDGTLHPGLEVALARFDFNETDVAKALASGDLASPAKFANSWYFRIRISGTGYSYRPSLDEYVYRPIEVYINPDFLDRVRGLPVIWLHPKDMTLDTGEFRRRMVGTVVVPYIGDEDGANPDSKEVWGVARIIDMEAAEEMREKRLSTSPAVDFGDDAVTLEKVKLDDGRHLLLEGNPKHLDHVAICRAGVWDKMGPPSGIDNGKRVDDAGVAGTVKEVKAMADEDRKEEKMEDDKRDDRKRDDEEHPGAGKTAEPDDDLKDLAKKIADGMDSIHKRMDSMEEKMKEDKRDDRKRDDESAETEMRQAAELDKLASEEEAEAAKMEEKKGDKKRDDRKRDDTAKHRMMRRDDESAEEHSDRVHEAACEADASRFKRRDDESEEEHSKRVDAMFKRHAGVRRDSDMDEEHHENEIKDDKKRDDRKGMTRDSSTRRDNRRDDETAEEKFKEEEKEETARGDSSAFVPRSEFDRMAADLRALQSKVGPRAAADEAALANLQSRADSVYSAFGERAPAPLLGETETAYSIRLARGMQQHSTTWKNEDLGRLASHSPTAYASAVSTIYADAIEASARQASSDGGVLIPISRRLPTGHNVIEYQGDPAAWMSTFGAQYGVGKLRDPRRAH